MQNNLLVAGIACMIAALIGGGLKAFAIEIPLLSSVYRQIMLGLFGAILMALSFTVFRANESPAPPVPTSHRAYPAGSTPAFATTTPGPTAKPRVIYAPAPAFPPGVSQPGFSGTGRFRLTFAPKGNVTNVQVIQSTGNPYFDQVAIKTLWQWKSAPSEGWAATVPVTFQAK